MAAIDTSAVPKAADTGSAPPSSRAGAASILVVDDRASTREFLVTLLGYAGHRTLEAANGKEALEMVRRHRPDLVISDIAMPEEDGYVLIRKIRARGPRKSGDIPAAALTAYAKIEDRVSILAAGFQMYLSKPADPSELIAVVASLASSRRRSQEVGPNGPENPGNPENPD